MTKDTRAAFEEFARGHLLDLEKLSMYGTYRNNTTRHMWHAYEAATNAAAAEIERLRDVVDTIGNDLDAANFTIESLRAENKRLRKVMAAAANLNTIHNDGLLGNALREYYNPELTNNVATIGD